MRSPAFPNTLPETGCLRSHWKWGARHAAVWTAFVLAMFAAAIALLDELSIGEAARTSALVLLGTLILVNAVWRAAGAVAARLEFMRGNGSVDEKPE